MGPANHKAEPSEDVDGFDDHFLRKFDWFVLKPSWLVFIGLSCYFLFRAEWLVGLGILALALLGVGSIGAALHREKSFADLAAGYPNHSFTNEETPTAIGHDTSLKLAN